MPKTTKYEIKLEYPTAEKAKQFADLLAMSSTLGYTETYHTLSICFDDLESARELKKSIVGLEEEDIVVYDEIMNFETGESYIVPMGITS